MTLNNNAKVIFLTGLSGSGKTTIAISLFEKYKLNGIIPILLDGDTIRNELKLFGFDEASRKKHNIEVGKLAALLEKKGYIVIVALIAPYAEVRNEIRKLCKTFFEIYVSTPLKTCIQRDVKGLYAEALSGELNDFTGISAPYFAPINPEITIDTTNISVEETILNIFNILEKK